MAKIADWAGVVLKPTPLLALVVLSMACSRPDPPTVAEQLTPDSMSDGAENVRLVGHHDLQGRQSLEVKTKSDAANGNWVYVGHSPNNRVDPAEPILNPITNQREWNGTSILDISDPANPRLVWHIPNTYNANSRAVAVVYDYQDTGRDFLARSSDADDESGDRSKKFQIFDITSRGSDPSQIALVSEITGTPPNSCGRGCGGPFIQRAHKGYWSQQSGLYYTAAGEPGFRSAIIQIFDLKDPKTPKFVGRLWLPGQKEGEPGFEGQYAHHPIVDEANSRLYVGFRTTGWLGSWDISNPVSPKMVWAYDTSPPGRGPHTVSPIVYRALPDYFKADGMPRTYAFVTDEASGGPDSSPCPNPVRTRATMFDITDETHPMPVSTWQVPVGDFCEKGGRFGVHQHAETVNSELNRFEEKLAWIAYFNAGIRVLDLSDPYRLRQAGYYIPKTTANSHPLSPGQKTAIQINDVDIDHRGLAYASDRVGTGLFVLEYTGPKPGTAPASDIQTN